MKVFLKLTLIVLCFATAMWADSFAENFNDVSTLASAGWVVVNNSTPGGTTSWFQGNPSVFTAQSGPADSYIAANFDNAPLGGNISNYLITPELSLNNGESVSFYARTETLGAIFNDSLELLLSTAGASTSIADFTTLLLSINPAQDGSFPEDWTKFSVTLSGLSGSVSGRLAFHYTVTDTSVNGDYIGIDTLRVPEPGSTSAVILAMGLIGLVLFRHKQRFV